MDTLTRTEFLAKPEVTDALTRLKETARRALPDASFAEREEALLTLFEEAGRRLLEDELQSLADGLGDRVLVGGVEYKRHELGTVQYYCLLDPLHIERPLHATFRDG